MKRILINALLAIVLFSTIFYCTGCATVFGGRVSDCQRTKPASGEPSRRIRAAAMIADILLFWPGLIVDFATAAIYKPCNR
jgi:hypothetical protein